jgi:hypothetical protein
MNNEKLIEAAPQFLDVCNRFLKNWNLDVFNTLSEEHINIFFEMNELVNSFETIGPPTERDEQTDELILLREAISKAVENGITLSLSKNADHDLIKKHYLGKFEVNGNKMDTIDHFTSYLNESFILGAEDRIEVLTKLLNIK